MRARKMSDIAVFCSIMKCTIQGDCTIQCIVHVQYMYCIHTINVQNELKITMHCICTEN